MKEGKEGKESKTNDNEINLLQLVNLVFNWLKSIFLYFFVFIGYLLKLSYKHKIITIVFLLCSVSIGLYQSRPSAKIYKAEAMVMINGSEAQTVKEVCKQLENYSSEKKIISLSSKLSIPDSIAKNIVSIQSFYVIDYLKDGTADFVDFKNSHSLTDTLNKKMKDRLYFRVKIKNINQISVIQDAILQYLNNNKVLKTDFETKREEYKQQVLICNRESERIDSLAKVSYFKDRTTELRFTKDQLLLGEQKKQLFYDDLLRLQDLRAFINSKLADFKTPVYLPSGFVVNPSPENGSLKYSAIALIVGYLISLLLLVIIDNFKRTIKYLESK